QILCEIIFSQLHHTFIGSGFSFALFTFFTVQQHAKLFFATLLGHHPGPILPRRGMPYMLAMSAGQLCNPMLFFIQMKTDNCLLHGKPPFELNLPQYLSKIYTEQVMQNHHKQKNPHKLYSLLSHFLKKSRDTCA